MNPSSSKVDDQHRTPYQLEVVRSLSQKFLDPPICVEQQQEPNVIQAQQQTNSNFPAGQTSDYIGFPIEAAPQVEEQGVLITNQRTPVKTRCYHCGYLGDTKIYSKQGCGFWCVKCCLPFGLCLVIINDCSDVIHQCWACNRQLARIAYRLCED